MSRHYKPKHAPCACGCGEMADECMSGRSNPLAAFTLNSNDNHPRSPFMVQANAAYHEAAGEWGFDHQRDAFLEGYRSGWDARGQTR
jgi:hypothetical protein